MINSDFKQNKIHLHTQRPFLAKFSKLLVLTSLPLRKAKKRETVFKGHFNLFLGNPNIFLKIAMGIIQKSVQGWKL